MNIRQQLEEHEGMWLDPLAAKSVSTRGRMVKEPKSPLRTEYMRDRDRIIHCKAFRRLHHKTQVFISPSNDHFRTRATHTLEVMQISTDIAQALRLNRDLAEAISLGHDLGHSPFGHMGEAILNQLYQTCTPNGSFRHAEFSLRIVDELEKRNNRKGLNLTWETRDGILNHSKGLRDLSDFSDPTTIPTTREGQIVRLVDRIAYVSHDFDDALKGGFVQWKNIPPPLFSLFSRGTSSVINFFAKNLIQNFLSHSRIFLSHKELLLLEKAKQYLTVNVYSHSSFLSVRTEITQIMKDLFQFFFDHPEQIEDPSLLTDLSFPLTRLCKARVVIDYLAGMTDRFALSQYEKHKKKRILWKFNLI